MGLGAKPQNSAIVVGTVIKVIREYKEGIQQLQELMWDHRHELKWQPALAVMPAHIQAIRDAVGKIFVVELKGSEAIPYGIKVNGVYIYLPEDCVVNMDNATSLKGLREGKLARVTKEPMDEIETIREMIYDHQNDPEWQATIQNLRQQILNLKHSVGCTFVLEKQLHDNHWQITINGVATIISEEYLEPA